MHCEICFDMERTTELLVLSAFVILNGFTLMCVVYIVHYASEAQEVIEQGETTKQFSSEFASRSRHLTKPTITTTPTLR